MSPHCESCQCDLPRQPSDIEELAKNATALIAFSLIAINPADQGLATRILIDWRLDRYDQLGRVFARLTSIGGLTAEAIFPDVPVSITEVLH